MAEAGKEDGVKKTAVKKPPLVQRHPDLDEKYVRMNRLFDEIHRARSQGAEVRAELVEEARKLLEWADGVVQEEVEDVEAFRKALEKDEEAFATALRLKGDRQAAGQVLRARDELATLF